jgi:hypothetical protein
MRSLGTRRVAQAAGAAMIAVIALAGCSAGQVAETALLKAPVSGLNTQSPDGKLLIRNLQVVYNGPDGYEAGSSAPLEVSLFNQTQEPLTVLISSAAPASKAPGLVSAEQIGVGSASAAASPSTEPSTGPTPDPSAATPDPSASGASAPASAEPTGSALPPAKFTIAPLSSQTFLDGDEPTLVATGLSGALKPGFSLTLTVEVQGGQALQVLAPIMVPTSPASRAPGVEGENNEE